MRPYFVSSILAILSHLDCSCIAAEIFWQQARNISGQLTDFDSQGSPVLQWNAGSQSVTVDPEGLNLTFEPGPSLSQGTYDNIDPHNRGGDNHYEHLLGSMSWASSTESLLLPNLTPGDQYRLQIWMADTRSGSQNRLKTYDSGNGTAQVSLNSGPPSQYVIGTFRADATSQTVRLVGGAGADHPQYNALALRSLGPPTPMVHHFEASYQSASSPSGINISAGDAVILHWQTSGADRVSISPEIGTVDSTETITVSPASTTTYTLSASNAYGSTTHEVTVFVGAPVTPPRINEIVSNNDSGLEDEDGDKPDWLELYNPNPFVIDAGQYNLTDDPSLSMVWQIPTGTMVPAQGYLVIFASGKNRTGATLHTDFKLDSSGDYLALIDTAGNSIISHWPHDYPSHLLFPKIPKDTSYGYNPDTEIRFFSQPTPGEENQDGVLGFIKDTSFSHDRGFYEAGFNLAISSDSVDATIRYTTDGSLPSESRGIIYTSPIEITKTTVVRAMAYSEGYASTNVDTHTYIFPNDVIASDIMDTGITQHSTYGPQMTHSLKALPVISLNIEDNHDLDNSTEHLTSVEMIFPDHSPGFQVDAGVTHFGGYFTDFAKKNFRLYFRKQYGPGKLSFPLFQSMDHGIAPVEKFDALDLRSGSHDMAMRGAYMSNRFSDDTMLEMGNLSPHGRFVHVFRNGVYWGQYHLRERWDASMAADYLGGNKDSYEAINGNANVGGWSPGVAYDGDGSGWTYIKNLASEGTPWQGLPSRVDMQSYIDFCLLYDFGSCENEYRSVLQPFDNGVGMRIYLNDADGFLNPTGIAQNNDAGGPGNLLGQLLAQDHPDFKTYLADRIYQHYFHDGVLTAEQNIKRLQTRVTETQLSFYCESARWGYRSPSSWMSYQNNLIHRQFPSQTASRLTDLRNAGYYPDVEAPEFNRNGGVVSPGFGLYFSSSSGGSIYYTTDGTDPRLPGGAINPTAMMLSGERDQASTLIAAHSEWKYLDDGSNQGSAWKESNFNDTAWPVGQAKMGYGDGDETTTISYGGNSADKHITTYLRKTFNVTNAASYTNLTLSLLCDDGAAVYINGQEIYSHNTDVIRKNLPSGTITSTTLATSAVGGLDESAFTQYEIHPELLIEGSNTIAVEVHQAAITSSDIGFDLQLRGASGAISPDLILTADTQIHARVLKNGTWSAMHPALFVVSQPPVSPGPGDLVISEIHYHPSAPTHSELSNIPGMNDDDFEFLEFMNVHHSPLRLDGCSMIDGIDFTFPAETILQPGASLVIAKNITAFALRSGGVAPVGQYSGSLKNSGERIAMENIDSTIIIDLTYADGTDRNHPMDLFWPSKPDGQGKSLVFIHPHGGGNIEDPLLWRSSNTNHGSPNTSDSLRYPSNLNQDLDRDGYSSLIELSLNSSDSNAGKHPTLLQQREILPDGTTYMTLTFLRNARYESSVIVQTSSDLDLWNNDAVILQRQSHNDGSETLQYRFPVEFNGRPQFMRIKVKQ